jgi:phosphoglycolate phosphatase
MTSPALLPGSTPAMPKQDRPNTVCADLVPRRYRFVVFDWDGTLVDSTALIAHSIRMACRDIGEPMPDEATARFVIGLGHSEVLRRIAPGLARERQHELTERYRFHFLARDAEIPLFAGVLGMLDELDAAGTLLGIATGKSRAGLERALAQQGVANRFVATRCADESPPKPHPGMLLHLMERVGVDPSETLMIGDTTHDLELARNAGVASLAVSYGAHEPEALARFDPLATMPSPLELRQWLRVNG